MFKFFTQKKWYLWSIGGTIVILLATWYQVQLDVKINEWFGEFYDTLQKALTTPGSVSEKEFIAYLFSFAKVAGGWVIIAVFTGFLVSHWVFRWRTSMADYYHEQWKNARMTEGASQRVQEDTLKFARIMEGLGVSIIDAVMTLFAFLPLLFQMSQYVETLPIVGAIPYPLFTVAIFWSLFGTSLLAIAGIKLPGLEFRNQRVEAAYRKELVYGEDDESRAQPPTLSELFGNVRRNYFRLYFHYMYFNVARSFYLQADNIFAYLLLIPTIAVGAITFGLMQQILTAFSQVTNSFQYLVNSWPTIVELLSIYKRLQAFEASIYDTPLPQIDQDFMAVGKED